MTISFTTAGGCRTLHCVGTHFTSHHFVSADSATSDISNILFCEFR